MVQRTILDEAAHGRPAVCGALDGSDVVIRSEGGAASSWWGWQTCGWADCSHCGPTIRLHRFAEAAEVVGEGERRGLIWLMATLSPPHRVGTPIQAGIDRFKAVWSGVVMTKDKTMLRRWRRRWAADVFFVAWECTLAGERGHHPHWHVLIGVDPAASEGVTELAEEMAGFGWDDAKVAGMMPTFLADEVQTEFLAAMSAWAYQPAKPGEEDTDRHRVDRRWRRRVVAGWTVAGVHVEPAGVGAARYMSKLAPSMGDDELRRHAEGTSFELTNASGAKDGGGVSTTTAMALLGGEWGDSREGRVRRPQIRRWLAGDPRRQAIAAGFAEWREATLGQSLLKGSPAYYKLLPSTWEELTDDQILAKRGEVVRADQRRRELLRQNRDRAAAAGKTSCLSVGIDAPEEEAQADDDGPGDDVLDSDWTRTVYLDPLVAREWARDMDDDARASLMALHDGEGPWGVVVTVGNVWVDRERAPVYVHERAEDGALRVGRHRECWRDGTWQPVAPWELAERWTPPDAGEIAA